MEVLQAFARFDAELLGQESARVDLKPPSAGTVIELP
jgi:hypothetical protein